MTKKELQNKIYRDIGYIYSDNPKACVNMRRVFELLIDEMFRLHEEGLK